MRPKAKVAGPRKGASRALGAAQEAVTAAEEQWLTLEMLREEIEG